MSERLTEKQRMFVKEYLIDLNATQAAIRAGYSQSTAEAQSSRLLVNVNIQKEIEAAKDRRNEIAELDAVRVLDEVASLALSNIQNYKVDAYGQLSASEKDMRAIKKVRFRQVIDEHGNVTGTETSYELWDKPKALELLGKHMGLWGEKGQPPETSAMELFLKLYEQALARRNQNLIGG